MDGSADPGLSEMQTLVNPLLSASCERQCCHATTLLQITQVAPLRMLLITIIIIGVEPLRGFPVGRRGIGCRVPILGGRRLAGLVRLVGRARPSRGCQVGMAVQLVGPVPIQHGALGGRQAFTGCGPATDMVHPRPHSRHKVVRRHGGLLSIRPPGDAM